jgi:hypothetical protein
MRVSETHPTGSSPALRILEDNVKRGVMRGLIGLVSSLAMGAGLLAATAAPAAASSPCSGTHLGNWSITGGYISVYYNSSTGYNCALTYTNNPGVPQHIYVEINVTGSGTIHLDSGTYEYYAGPVSVYARDECIDFAGEVGSDETTGIQGVTHAYCS